MTAAVKVHFAGHEPVAAGLGESLLEVALAHGIALDHACGGVCACSTCHVKVTAGADAFDAASEDEEDQLDKARDVELMSRLGCQAVLRRVPRGGAVEVRIPAWNVNAVREGGG